MKNKILITVFLAFAMVFQGVTAYAITIERHVNAVTVDVVSDRGRVFRQYPVEDGPSVDRAYIEAVRGAEYGIRIRNNTGRRIGVVVAVDGRNIIDGKKSHLARTERMYILGPYETDTYDGWRTGKNVVNRFYFTDAGDSYAGAWDDYSAMGVIAVAVYYERAPRMTHKNERYDMEERSIVPKAGSAPGTGFGDEEYSPSVEVKFVSERSPAEKHFLKYEWRETLCRKGIIECRNHRKPYNRFWDRDNEGDFAPYPPR